MIDADGYNDHVRAYDGTSGWLSVRSFQAADVMIARAYRGEGVLLPSELFDQARQRIEDFHQIPSSDYRLRLALGASYVLLRLEYGGLVQD